MVAMTMMATMRVMEVADHMVVDGDDDNDGGVGEYDDEGDDDDSDDVVDDHGHDVMLMMNMVIASRFTRENRYLVTT